jgi:hypothetical protein
LRLEGTDGLRVIGISKLTDQEREVLKAHKAVLLEALHKPAEAIDDCQGETVSRVPLVKEDPWAVETRRKYRLYAPNCNCCRQYRWRSKTCSPLGHAQHLKFSKQIYSQLILLLLSALVVITTLILA